MKCSPFLGLQVLIVSGLCIYFMPLGFLLLEASVDSDSTLTGGTSVGPCCLSPCTRGLTSTSSLHPTNRVLQAPDRGRATLTDLRISGGPVAPHCCVIRVYILDSPPTEATDPSPIFQHFPLPTGMSLFGSAAIQSVGVNCLFIPTSSVCLPLIMTPAKSPM